MSIGTFFDLYPLETFGILSSNTAAENDAGIYRWMAHIQDRATRARPVYVIGPGTFLCTKLEFPGCSDGSTAPGGFSVIGAGAGRTVFQAAASDQPCFLTNTGGAIRDAVLSGLQFEGSASNTNQMGACFLGEPSSAGDFTGGWWNPIMDDVRFSGFVGPQLVFKGGQESSAGNLPNQFLNLRNVTCIRPATSPWPSMMVLGQMGQSVMQNLRTDPPDGSGQGGPGLYIGTHFSRTRPTFSAVDTTNDYFTSSTHYLFANQQVRFIGDLTGLTSSPQIAKGTTYFARPILKSAATSFHQNRLQFCIAADGSAIDVSAGGTPANYSIVSLWTTRTPDSNEFTAPFAHLLSTTDELQLHGSNLPSGLSTGTTYSVIRTGPKTFKLATNKTNARSGTAIAVSGGTPADWGIQVHPVSGTPYQPYSIKLIEHTSQFQQIGLWLGDCENIHVEPYYESLKRAFENWGCLNLSVAKGRLASAADDSTLGMLLWSQGANTRSTIDEDTLRIFGTTDTGRYAAINGPAQIVVKNNRQQSVAFSATPSVTLRSGKIINLAAITANITSFTLSDNPIAGEDVTINLVQDGTGGYTVALGSSFKGGSISSGTAGQKCTVWAKYDGTHWMYTFSAWA